ncbi:MAG: serine hydroxymethyltransferase [Alphaproteobacteria bacterium]|nr:MAG: serine hydroxymethyltransferase [Alphaproteobacteria bacterium]
MNDFLSHGLPDCELQQLLYEELKKQNETISLIASENLASTRVRYVQSTVLTNKYAEGYPGKRYYAGCEFVDQIEQLCQQRACTLFQAKYANVQPHSGSQANFAVFMSLLEPGDTILGMDLASGGHLTHGSKVNMSGKFFNTVTYGLDDKECIDMNEVDRLAKLYKPKLIIAGTSAYSRIIDWSLFHKVAKENNALLLVDMAHVSGLIAAGRFPNPLPHADVVTSTTHKTLKGPRGGIILTNNEEIYKKINKGVFPGSQGGPLMHIIAAKAMCFHDAMSEQFRSYIDQVLLNAKVMCEQLSHKFQIVSETTETHLFVLKLNNCTGLEAEKWLADAGIMVNKNMIPNDVQTPIKTSGIRIGTPLCTARGFGTRESVKVAEYIEKLIESKGQDSIMIKQEIEELCKKFPVV